MMKRSAILSASILVLADAANYDLVDITTIVSMEPAFETVARPCEPVSMEQLLAEDMLRSQDDEDRCMLTFFNGMCGGRYMEMGALDGVKYSNTYAFYKSPALNWRGVMVELIPENYEKLIRNRPDEWANVHGAVCDEPTTLHYYAGNSNAVGGIWEFASKEHRERYFPNVNLKDTMPIHCTPLQNILDIVNNDEAGTEKLYFDYFSLDIEGAEMSALQGIDWERTGFGIFIVEKNDPQVEAFLQSKGYNRVSPPGCSEKRNFFYINPEFDLIYNKMHAEAY